MCRSNQNKLCLWDRSHSSDCPGPFQPWLFPCPALKYHKSCHDDRWSRLSWWGTRTSVNVNKSTEIWITIVALTGVVLRVRSSGFLTKFCSNFSSTQVNPNRNIRPPYRRDSFDNFDKTPMKTRNNGLKYKEIKGLMYCFAEVGWEVFSRSFAAQAISLAFSGPFFGQFWVCAAIRTSHTKKPLPFINC